MAKDKDKRDENRRDNKSAQERAEERNGEASGEPIIRDKRRVDPETGDVRTPDGETTGGPVDGQADATQAGAGDETLTDEDIAKLLEPQEETSSDAASELLTDLKRLQAEYANYRKRVERDRTLARELAVAEVITGLLPVLDDLDLAEAHGDLEEGSPLGLVAQKFRASFERYGLERVGVVGEPFDPNLHEAIAQLPNAEVTSDTVADVVLPGYRLGERLLRAARVAVSVPGE